jgi:hypothetical protein
MNDLSAILRRRDLSAQRIDDVRVLRRHIATLLGVGLDVVRPQVGSNASAEARRQARRGQAGDWC